MISIKGITRDFGQLQVLKGIDLDINHGEILSIVGPSGAGKTTLLQIIGTLDRPTSGKIIYNGEDIMQFKDSKLAEFRNRNIGFVFQFHQLLPEFTVLENVAMPALIGNIGRNQAYSKAKELIDYMGLGDRMQHRPAQLSGGERQRVAVARALINQPKVILADEPSGSLDSHNRNELHRLFFNLRRDLGQTFVIVTHDESLAADTDRIIHMQDGLITNISKNTAIQ